MWTAGALASEARPYQADIWRVVELQYEAATMVLTDGLEEQALLERMLDESKPPMPPACERLDYLLATPFRYAPYPYGSRFRRANQTEGVFYGAEQVETAIAETAFYRLLFFAESPETELPSAAVQHTAFAAAVNTDATIDLTLPPFDRDRARWTDPTDYEACHALADAAREAAIGAILYHSVRDRNGGRNVALLTPAALASRAPTRLQTWHLLIRHHTVQAWCECPRIRLEFQIAEFSADPRLAPLFAAASS